MTAAASRLFVALDVETLDAAGALLDRLEGVRCGVKIGSQLFTAAGPVAVETALKRGFQVFLDLKYHDIPNTVAGAARAATRLGVTIMNVHASGGSAMMRAAADAVRTAATDFQVPRPLCLAVTVLTSLDRKALATEVGVPVAVEAHVLALANLTIDAGLDGAIASPQEIRPLRLALGPNAVILTPGIRPSSTGGSRSATGSPGRSERGGVWGAMSRPPSSMDDQVRTATATEAIRAGANYIVVGRPITQAPDPAAAAAALVEEIGLA
ncbi:MAG: orotidine-5'-phosphate decarboxylase [Candidatus Rokubacteria bacterium]|nr:orotidine-5'-phosphate decarboxylase [Candidatus Rokubacteria bacterium]